MGSDDETPRFRRQRQAGLDSSQRRRVPVIVDEDTTSPFDLFEPDRPPRREVLEHIERSARDGETPMTVSDGMQLADWTKRRIDAAIKRADQSAQRATLAAIDQVRELVTHPPDEAVTKLQSAVVQLEKDVEPVRNIRRLIAGSLAGIIITVGALLIERTRTEERTQARLEQVERVVEEIRQDLRAQARRMNKGTEP